jgi:hypothetical protein
MGAWSTSLYGNDTTEDVKYEYTNLLQKQLSNQEAYEKTLEAFNDCIGDSDVEPLFWFALADTQWKVGRLMPEVKANALEWIEKGGGLTLWEESKSKTDITRWKKTLQKLKTKLESEQPKEKPFRKKVIPNQNPWRLHDVYAYRLHSDHVRKGKEEEQALYGKYILMQKIGESKSIENDEPVMRVQLFNKLFDTVPSAEDAIKTVNESRLLPKDFSSGQEYRYKAFLYGEIHGVVDGLTGHRPSFYPTIMSMKMEDDSKYREFPKDELTYICNCEGPLNKQYERRDFHIYSNSKLSDIEHYDYWHSQHWNMFHVDIGRLFLSWQGVDYEDNGDGTFEYPTREQREVLVNHVKSYEYVSELGTFKKL